jgi:cobalt-zinc-cadmium efflux system outer membrane protein
MTAKICGGAMSLLKGPSARHVSIIRQHARISLVVGAYLLTSCAGYSPLQVDPFQEIRKLEQRAAQPLQFEVPPRGNPSWIPLRATVDLGDGLDLPEANTLALSFSPEIRSARSEQNVAGAQLLRAGLLSNPELFLGPRISSGAGGLILPAGLSWELPLWGQREAEKILAQRKLTLAEARAASVELRVLAEVRAAFIRISTLTKTSAALEAQLAGSERVLQWTDALRQAGEIDGVTSYLAKLERDDARANLEILRVKLESTRRDLLETTGLLPDAEVPIQLDPEPALMPALPRPDRRRMLLHPQIVSALSEHETAEAALQFEISSQYPAISIGPEFESDQGDASLGAGAGIELPLFERNQGGIAEAAQRREATREKVSNALLKLTHAEAKARAEFQAKETILRNYSAGAMASALEARRALDLRLQAGQSNVLEVLAGLRSITSARVRELRLKQESAIACFSAAAAGAIVLDDPSNKDSEKEKK